jgi:hypothetical protein
MMKGYGRLVEWLYTFELPLVSGSLEDARAYQNMLD